MKRKVVNLLLKSKVLFRCIWFVKELIICLTVLLNLRIRGFQILTCKSIKSIKKMKLHARYLTILGSGPSVKELGVPEFSKIDSGFSFAVGRWFYLDYVPDVLFVEFKNDALYYAEAFIKKINTKKNEYQNCIFILQVEDKKYQIHNLLKEKISTKLFKNIYFTHLLKSPSYPQAPGFFGWVLSNEITSFVLLKLGILAHCRSSVTCGFSLGKGMDINQIMVVGVDGYSGYFADKKDEEFHMKGNFDNARNCNFRLHSTSDPNHGHPTVPDCFLDASSYFEIEVFSKNSILSKMFPLPNLNLDQRKIKNNEKMHK